MFRFLAVRLNPGKSEPEFQIPIMLPNSYIKHSEALDKQLINLGYGYRITTKECTEGSDSALAGKKYKLHSQIMPKEGDYIIHRDSGRIFRVGKVDGFIHHQAPLLEDGTIVAYIEFEEYYKD